MSEDRTQLTITLPTKMKRRIDNQSEQEDYSGMSDYARSMIRAGESNIADLDPRTGSKNDDSLDIDTRLLDALTNEYQEVDKAIEPVLNSLATRLQEMAEDDAQPVEYHPRKGYKIKE